MKCKLLCVCFVVVLSALFGNATTSQGSTLVAATGGLGTTRAVNIGGIVRDAHGEPTEACAVAVYVRGKQIASTQTGPEGSYVVEFDAEKRDLARTNFSLEITKEGFRARQISILGKDLLPKGEPVNLFYDVTLQRVQGPAFWTATIVFVIVYALIVFEIVHRTIAAMLGAAAMLCISYTIGTVNPAFRILSFERAIASIDMNVILLLMGMMIIVGILKHTGVFQWCAYQSFRIARGKVFPLVVILMAFTAVTSSVLDNVTTMLLLTGVAIEICLSVQLNPILMLIPLVLASNVGGTATLIGDPPNIMIGSYARLTFVDFVVALAPLCGLLMIVMFLYTKIVWGKAYSRAQANVVDVDAFTSDLRAKYRISDGKLLTYGLVILGFMVFLFLSHGYWHMEVSIAALVGASILFAVATTSKKVDMGHLVEKEIEWPTLMFFIFLFITVGAVEEVGLLALVADWIMAMSAGNFLLAMGLILWVSAVLSAFVDNIPFTATMLPIVAFLSKNMLPGGESTLWWALALGACLGGNGTIIGASANVVTMGIAESKGFKTSFAAFMKSAFPYMILSVAICHLWLVVFRPS